MDENDGTETQVGHNKVSLALVHIKQRACVTAPRTVFDKSALIDKGLNTEGKNVVVFWWDTPFDEPR